jgi:Flp pilus assembly pilin Flp
MQKFGSFLGEFLTDESGISSVEYALLLAFVAGGIILGAAELSKAVQNEMEVAADTITGAP